MGLGKGILMFLLDGSPNLVLRGCTLLVHQQVPYYGCAMTWTLAWLCARCSIIVVLSIGPGISAPQGESQWILLHLPLCLAAEGMGGGRRLILCQLVLAADEALVVTVEQGKLHEPWEEGPELAYSEHSWSWPRSGACLELLPWILIPFCPRL